MAEAAKPTNESIVARLDEVLKELGELRRQQEQLVDRVGELAAAARG